MSVFDALPPRPGRNAWRGFITAKDLHLLSGVSLAHIRRLAKLPKGHPKHIPACRFTAGGHARFLRGPALARWITKQTTKRESVAVRKTLLKARATLLRGQRESNLVPPGVDFIIDNPLPDQGLDEWSRDMLGYIRQETFHARRSLVNVSTAAQCAKLLDTLKHTAALIDYLREGAKAARPGEH